MRSLSMTIGMWLAVVAAATVCARGAEPGPVPEPLRSELKLDPFYQKHLEVRGLPILGSARLSDHALAEAAWIVEHMLDGRDDILKAMRRNRVRVAVMAADEYTTDIPEHNFNKPKQYWDRRARGLGATPKVPVVSCGEENLLGFEFDPYPLENIFVHEFAHAIHETGMITVDPTFDGRLLAAYDAAKGEGLWKNTYAETNRQEYWAEGVQCWFDDNAPPDALHNDVRTRARLKKHDPRLAKLCEEVFGDKSWRYVRPALRTPADRAHLPGYDPTKPPRFAWRQVAVGERPSVRFETVAGDFDVELERNTGIHLVEPFLRRALHGAYHSGPISHGETDGASPPAGSFRVSIKPMFRDPEPTNTTAAKADDTPRTVSGDYLSAHPTGELHFSVGARCELPRGFVPLGRVVRNADVLRKLLRESARPTAPGSQPLAIRRVIRTE